MQPEIIWSDLLIETGTRDPLALWRVGDRLISELLPAFTTVVGQRPARYFNMYCWILREAGKACDSQTSDEVFWGNFSELEGIFLVAIGLHSPHAYSHFGGQIGTDHAGRLISHGRASGAIDFTALRRRRIANGWEPNYKNAMATFHLTESDPAAPGDRKLTERGEELAEAYDKSISDSLFFRNHRGERQLSLSILENLSSVACPCLLHAPDSPALASPGV
jgi:hypothetical protein